MSQNEQNAAENAPQAELTEGEMENVAGGNMAILAAIGPVVISQVAAAVTE
ncbi:MAG TPA: hypothetical protein VEX86_14615 [Longimicrobium sp.]|nr:hypothetical protein [Longimicrobium sp.]